MCGWKNGQNDEADWIRQKGPTGVAQSGPAGDHTSGNGNCFVLDPKIAIYTHLAISVKWPKGRFLRQISSRTTF